MVIDTLQKVRAANTIRLLQRQRMSDMARLLVTGRNTDSCPLHLHLRDCVWQLLEAKSAKEQVRKFNGEP